MKRIILSLFVVAMCVSAAAQIAFNQVGFYPNGQKVVAVVNASLNKDFRIESMTEAGKVVYEGKLSEPMKSKNSSLTVRLADFSELTAPGSYRIIAGAYRSEPFNISENIHREVGKAVLKAFYYQRVSMPLEKQYAGRWARPAGHPDDVVYIHPSAATKKRPAGSTISSVGGWYDAGDYNKYIVNCGITMGTMLSAYEDYPGYYANLGVNIPESGNAAPDLLDEIAYNLRWMLTMQDPHDGGVYNKCTNANFDGMVMPGVTKEPRYVVQKGTAAALDFAAVTAQAARIYKLFPEEYPGLADACLKASVKAWNWAVKNPDMVYDQNKMNKEHEPIITTGGYGDGSFNDEWFWAASELYLSTKNKKYKKEIDKNIRTQVEIPTWGSVYMLGVYSLLRLGAEEYPGLMEQLTIYADKMVADMKENAFGVVMGREPRDWMWGSSSQAANQGILLLNAYRLTNNKAYLNAALTNADYLLGRNATGYSFVTGFGSWPVMNIHHRPSAADGIKDPIPGFLSGGPNATAHRSDGKSQRNPNGVYYEFTEPETTFADDEGSYAANEIAINWNAPAVYFFNAIEASYNQ